MTEYYQYLQLFCSFLKHTGRLNLISPNDTHKRHAVPPYRFGCVYDHNIISSDIRVNINISQQAQAHEHLALQKKEGMHYYSIYEIQCAEMFHTTFCFDDFESLTWFTFNT